LEQTLETMAARSSEIVDTAVESFFAGDVDTDNRTVLRRVLSLGADEERHEWGLRMIVVARSAERIGDHAVDIGEHTAHLATGTFHEFTDASQPAATA
jgi:phosphate transport system protein